MSFLLKAQNTWENFAKYKINDYAKLRNFDFGPITKVQFQNYRLSLLIEFYRNMI